MVTQIRIDVDEKGNLNMDVGGLASPIHVLGVLELAKASVSSKLTGPKDRTPKIAMPDGSPIPHLNGN